MPRLQVFRNVCLALIAAALAGCATPGSLPPTQVSDPAEGVNRAVFAFNSGVNKVVVFPLAKGYETVVPPPARQAVANGLSNLNEPVVFSNAILQGRFRAAGLTLQRFLVNSTIGFGGIADVATLGGIPKQTGDFGQTLFVWGWNDSPFIMLPILGPTTIRDGIGRGVDGATSPGMYAIYRVGGRVPTYALGGFDGIRRAGELQLVDETAVDPYARVRSIYFQNRRGELLDGIGRKDEALEPVAAAPTPPRPARRR